MSEDTTGYNLSYYIGNDVPERQSFQKGILRPGDMGAALGYALGIRHYADIRHALGIPEEYPRFLPDIPFTLQLTKLLSIAKRIPKGVLEVGSGRGELACAFRLLAIPYIGLEPSAAAHSVMGETKRKFMVGTGPTYAPAPAVIHQMGLSDYVFDDARTDTIIFVESIEHIQKADFERQWPVMVERLKANRGLFIVTNWIDFHPIHADDSGWNHVRTVDDAFYDTLAREANHTVFRQGSHLVLEF